MFPVKDLLVIKCWSLSIFGQGVKLLCLSKLHQKYRLAGRAIVQNLPQPTVLCLATECCKIDILYRLLQAWKIWSSILVTSAAIIQLPSHRVTEELRKSHIQDSLEQAITSDTCKCYMEILWYTNSHWNSISSSLFWIYEVPRGHASPHSRLTNMKQLYYKMEEEMYLLPPLAFPHYPSLFHIYHWQLSAFCSIPLGFLCRWYLLHLLIG